jgi:3-isopropylmalate/(R)-2-methylmalate dehydratase large subunit
MSIEWGARVGMVAPDDTTFAYLEGREHAPKGAGWERALEEWRELPSDPDAVFDDEIRLDAVTLEPFVTWGTNPGQAVPVSGRVPAPADADEERALRYMALTPGTAIQDIAIDRVFIGSCNADILQPGERCASTSNRNFEGRQGAGGRTHLLSPPMAAAAALAGHLVDVREVIE